MQEDEMKDKQAKDNIVLSDVISRLRGIPVGSSKCNSGWGNSSFGRVTA